MKSLSFLIVIVLFSLASSAQQVWPVELLTVNTAIRTGAERTDVYLSSLEGKNVAVVANPTSLVKNTHLVDTLLSLGIRVKKVFAPEHGFRGDAPAGEIINDGKDNKTGLPLISLYGKNKKPSAEMLKEIDIILFDIQDV